MTEEIKPNFLKSIKFEEDFLPFKQGTKVKFGGETEVQRMIEFYLKNKGIDNYKENAKRFKINCVLGNNGGGKSRLFRGLYAIENTTDIYENINLIINQVDSLSVTKVDEKYTDASGSGEYQPSIILDDFFKLSGNIDFSVNENVLSKNYLQHFYFHTYKNLTLNIEFKKLFTSFLKNIDNYNLIIETKYTGNLSLEKFDRNVITKFLHDIFESDFQDISIAYIDLFIKNIEFSFEELNKNTDKGQIIFSKLIQILENIDGTKYFLQENSRKFKELNSNFIKIFNYEIVKRYKTYNEFIEYSFGKEEFKLYFDLIDQVSYQSDKKNHITDDIFNNPFNAGILESTLINSDLSFGEKTFENLSAGEKTMLIRFTNIYKDILEQKEKNGKTDFLILIDEPDLHLHLDWQRQYIQKLIDVFSTLDPEINLHFIIATHSPFIISDLPQKSLVLLENGKQIEYEGETFGANYIDIIKNGFFFEKEQMLMGSFSQNIIGDIAENERQHITNNQDLHENHEEIKNNIGDEFLKDNLLYFKPEKND